MSIIPQPKSVTIAEGHFEITSLDDAVCEIDSSLPPESYEIDITTDKGVRVRGGSAAGLFYARQTLRQLLPPAALRKAGPNTKGPWLLQAQHISDGPSSGLSWRGCMLDVARHFMPVPDVLRFIELLAFHKLNVLHFHLTDDQGWRIEIPTRPRLTTVGGWRARSMRSTRHHQVYDAQPHGGFYSHEDLREIIAFASERHINVVPEVNMPGHMQAAIAAYPELGNMDVEGRDPNVQVWDSWGVSKKVLNVSDSTLDFCREVLDVVCDIFPSNIIGIGGDECPYDEWKASSAVQSRMKELGLNSESAVQGWFTNQMAAHLSSRGKRAYAWDEIVAAYSGPKEAVIVAAWRGPGPTALAARRGFEVITCPDVNAYLDYRQSEDPGEPTPVGTLLTLEDVYAFEPVPAGLKAEEAARIVGAQVNVWVEHMETARRVEYMVYPRACAFAEVAWGKTKGSDDFESFRKRLEDKHFARLEALGVNYRLLTGPRPWDGRPDAPGNPQSRHERMKEIDRMTEELWKQEV